MKAKLVLLTLVSFAMLWIITPQLSPAAEAAKPAVLILYPNVIPGYGEMDMPFIAPELKSALNKEGYQIDDDYYFKFSEPQGFHIDGAYFKDVTAEMLKNYNIVIIDAVPSWNYKDLVKMFLEKFDVIKDYAASGGGLLILHQDSYGAMTQVANEAYAKIGLTILHEPLQVHDESLLEKKYNADFLKVNDFFDSPITQDITKLLFPTRVYGATDFGSSPVRVDDNWNVIVKAPVSVSTESYKSSPPLVATRTFGKGRIGVISSQSSVWIEAGWHRFWHNGYMFENSDDLAFLENMLNWVGEPSFAAGLGGYVQVEKPKKVLGEFEGTYRRRIAEKPDEKAFPGIIGIKTTYSGYDYTVADFAGKAKQAGLNFIVIAADKSKMNEQKWNELVKDCANASDGSLLVIPGIDYVTKPGWRIIYFNFAHNYTWISDDKFKGADTWDPSGVYGGLAYALFDAGAVILTEPHRNGYNPYWTKFFAAFDVYHYDEKLALADTSLDWYKDIASHYYIVMPTVVTEITEPDQLLSFNGYKTFALAKSVYDIPEAFDRSKISQTFVSAGPVITEFWLGGYGASEDAWEYYHLWYPGDAVEIHMGVTSEKPLKQVTVYKDNKAFRRYYPDDTTFAMSNVDIARQSGVYVMIAEDIDGNQAISSPLPIRHFERWSRMCADQQNTIDNYIVPDESGNLIIRGRRCAQYEITRFNQRSGYRQMFALRDASTISPGSFEVGPEGALFFQTRPSVRTTKGEVAPAWPETKIEFGSGDCMVESNLYTGDVIEADNPYYVYTPRGTSINMILIDYNITFKKDLELSKDKNWDITLLTSQCVWDAQTPNYLTFDGSSYDEGSLYDNGKPITVVKHIGPNGYAAIGPDYWGSPAVFGFGDVDLVASMVPRNLDIGMKLPGKTIKKGTTLKFRLLIAENSRYDQTNLDFAKEIYDMYGLDSSTSYKINLEQGTVVNDQFILHMRAQDGYVKGNIKRADLANDLYVRVDGVEDNWASGLYDYSSKTLHLAGSHNGTVYTEWDINPGEGKPDDVPLFIGNFVMCENPDVKVDIVKLNEDGTCLLHLHNPLPEAVTVTIKPVLDVITASSVTVDLKPGQSLDVTME